MTGLEEDKNTITALDYIKSQELLEKEAQSVLPGKFEKYTETKEPAGMCYSCSIACHSSHELFELFPKRAFRCDCGLPGKFQGHACALTIPAKKIIKTNDKNKYNHNFEGRYCRCDQHYDPEKEEGTMYQCVACEDWFHENCIGDIPDSVDDFECYICRDCSKKYSFLMNGKDDRFSFGLSKGTEPISQWILPQSQIVDVVSMEEDQTGNVVEEKTDSSSSKQPSILDETKDQTTIHETEEQLTTTEDHQPSIGEKRKLETEPSHTIIPNTFKKLKTDEGCQNIDISLLPEHDHIEIFLQDGWRDGLCKCVKCVEDYKTNNVEYLLAEEKTYEPEEDEDAGKSLLEIGMEQLQRLDRVQALEGLRAYTKFNQDIKTFFESFKVSGKTVTEQDIKDFFEAKRRDDNQ
ncbi:hypothetical protein BD770DRAFT_432272 [Pilaira anomala]|nr:hypothetical protein BD770DRAFT_432272 [Pilaira anomala]